MRSRTALFLAIVGTALGLWAGSAAACGGFFCQNQPVDQTGERIVFTVNDDGTLTTLIQIQYFGSADDFSWILPIPEPIGADDLAVPEDGDAVFDELHALTDVQVIAPEPPDCAVEFLASVDMAAEGGGVDVFASGEVGPFGFDVVGSEDPDELVTWLRDNEYQVTTDMEPLIDFYVEDRFAFVAMRLLDGETSDSITPIEITYPSVEPMIPLVLTAVAAQPNMPVWVWVMADGQAVPANYAHMEIATEEITFFPFGGNDYTFLVQQRADAFDGHGFITEFAGPAAELELTHPWLLAQAEDHPYVTRLNTYIDPAEMTIDPVFSIEADRPDVSNVRDASDLNGLYACERDGGGGFLDAIFGDDSDAIDPTAGTARVVAFTPGLERVTDETPPTSAAPGTDGGDQGATDAGIFRGETATGQTLSENTSGGNWGLIVAAAVVALALGAGSATVLIRRRT